MSIAGCLWSWLLGPSVRAIDRVLEVRGWGPKSTQSLVTSCVQIAQPHGTFYAGTRIIQLNWINNRLENLWKVSQVKAVNTDRSPKGRMARPWIRTRSGVRRYRWSHREPHGLRRNPTHGEMPQPQEWLRAKDGNRQPRHGARGATMRTGSTNETDTKKKAEGTLRT